MLDTTSRFSDRAGHYVKYRPHYPAKVLDILHMDCGLTSEWLVADIASGTGFLTELFLENGNITFGVEPNQDMREAGEEYLDEYPNFVSVNGTAESTTLDSQSVDLVTAAEAFHWFDLAKAKVEFRRILNVGGWLALVRNERMTDDAPFSTALENLVAEYHKENGKRRNTHPDEKAFADFFAPFKYMTRTCTNEQELDLEGLQGRIMSMSTMPLEGQPGHDWLMSELEGIFNEHQKDGKVAIKYNTVVRLGRLK